MNTLSVAPVALGCCPPGPRCALCGPPPETPSADLVEALVEATRRDRGEPVVVSFFGGPPPPRPLLAALRGRPFTVRIRPDLLTAAVARALADQGCLGIELDALTFDDAALRATSRPYRAARVLRMLDALRALPVRVGVVLAPGLPRSSSAMSVADARLVVGRVDTVRLHPALVLRDSRLFERHAAGFFEPMGVADAVATCRAMLDVLEPAGIEVLRVGLQPVHDGYGVAVAGPSHPSLRELVEAHRAREAVSALMGTQHRGRRVVVRCAPCDETRTRGPRNDNVRTLRADHALAGLAIQPDPALQRGALRLEVA